MNGASNAQRYNAAEAYASVTFTHTLVQPAPCVTPAPLHSTKIMVQYAEAVRKTKWKYVVE